MNHCPSFSKPFFLLLFLGVFNFTYTTAQPFPAPGTNHLNAPIITCLDGFTGIQLPESYSFPFPGVCGVMQNAQWIGFIAERTDMVLSCSVFDCIGAANGGFGVQLSVVGVGNTCQPSSFYTVACDGTGSWNQQDFTLSGLQIGRIYYVVVDGYAGDHCSYTLTLDAPLQGPQPIDPTLNGSTVVQAGSVAAYDLDLGIAPYINHNPCGNDFTTCDGTTCDYEFTYTWTAPPGAIVLPYSDQSIGISWGNISGPVCVTINNPCLTSVQLCLDVTVVDVDGGPCSPGFPTLPGDNCADAPFLCGNVLHGFCGNTGQTPADSPGNLASEISCPIDNNQWLKFTPCASTIHLAIETSACLLGSSLELAILQTDDCSTFQSVLSCQPLPAGFTSSFAVDNLIPGEIYYLMMDGVNGQDCDYQIFVLDGISQESPEFTETTAGFITGPSEVCPEEQPVYTLTPPSCMPVFADGCPFPETLAADLKLIWHLPPGMHFIGDSVDVLSIQVAITDTTDGSIYVTYETVGEDGVYCTFNIGDCGQVPAFPVVVKYLINQLPTAFICADESFNFCGQDYNQSQTLVCPEYCGETRQELVVLPLDTIFAPVVELCEGETYNFCSQVFSGTQSTVLYCRNNCEITGQEIIVHPKVVNDFGTSFFCPGACYEFQGQQFCNEGTYEVEVPGAFGCDETFRITLQHYIPPALQITTATTDCEINSNAYQVTFSILNGVAPFSVNGQVITGNTYTSDWIANGVSYDFEITDSDLCPAITSVQGVFDCTSLCTTYAGTLQGIQLSGCGDEPVQVAIGNDAALDPNDMAVFLLHDGTATTLGNILEQNQTGIFNFQAATMLAGQSYYISLLAGNANAGTVDLNDACLSLSDGLSVVFYELPLATAAVEGVITCTEMEATLSAGPPISGATYAWTGPDGLQMNVSEFVTGVPGEYQLIVTSADGCTVTSQVTVEEKIDLPILDAGVADDLNCTTLEVQLNGSLVLNGSNIEFLWQTTTGNFAADEETLQPTVDLPGMYYLYAINRDNGCEAWDSVLVLLDESYPEATVLDIQQPNCFGEASGSIEVSEVVGGTAPYLYSINESALGQSPVFSRLTPGNYQLVIQDANGCELIEEIILQTPKELVVEFRDDVIYTSLGEIVDLNPVYNFDPDSVSWTNAQGEVIVHSDDTTSVASLLALSFPALNNETLEILMVAPDGCTATDQVSLFVDRRENIFIPNAFSPNGDGDNDFFTVFSGKSVDAIKSMTIYNRWGEIVFQRGNFAPNDLSSGWDGTAGGKRLNDGVFVYQVELLLVNGEEKTYAGDLVLIK